MKIRRAVYRQPDGGTLIELACGDGWATRSVDYRLQQGWTKRRDITYSNVDPITIRSQMREWITFERRIGSTLEEIELCR